MNIKETGVYIKKRRQYLRITQEDLSQLSGVSLRTIRNIENGKHNREKSIRKRFVKALKRLGNR